MLLTIFDSIAKEQLAATKTLAVPAKAVTKRMVCKTGIALTPLPFS
jgi:hypothetical protein